MKLKSLLLPMLLLLLLVGVVTGQSPMPTGEEAGIDIVELLPAILLGIIVVAATLLFLSGGKKERGETRAGVGTDRAVMLVAVSIAIFVVVVIGAIWFGLYAPLVAAAGLIAVGAYKLFASTEDLPSITHKIVRMIEEEYRYHGVTLDCRWDKVFSEWIPSLNIVVIYLAAEKMVFYYDMKNNRRFGPKHDTLEGAVNELYEHHTVFSTPATTTATSPTAALREGSGAEARIREEG
mgnify:CR=1 FL=1